MQFRFGGRRLTIRALLRALAKKVNKTTDKWSELTGVETLARFTVAGAKAALLQDIRKELDLAINTGASLDTFLAGFLRLRDRWTGAKPWRGQLIYDMALRQAHSIGRLQQLNEVKNSRPYWLWRHGGTQDPRPEHLAMDGKVYRADEVTAFPPAGFGCACRVFSLSPRQFERMGVQASAFTLVPDKGFADRKDYEQRINDMRVDDVLKRHMRRSMGLD